VGLLLESLVEKIRVLVANRPRLMRELILATISEQPDIEVIGEIKNPSEIVAAVAERHPHFVIIAMDKIGERPAICDELLTRYPQVKIVALAPENGSSLFCWAVLDIHSDKIEMSEEGLLNLLRGRPQLMSSSSQNAARSNIN
jgi:DNA-binding NarL/FixJ family response regulator